MHFSYETSKQCVLKPYIYESNLKHVAFISKHVHHNPPVYIPDSESLVYPIRDWTFIYDRQISKRRYQFGNIDIFQNLQKYAYFQSPDRFRNDTNFIFSSMREKRQSKVVRSEQQHSQFYIINNSRQKAEITTKE